MEQSKKELAQKQANRIGEIEGKLEGLRVLVTGLVSLQMNISCMLYLKTTDSTLTLGMRAATTLT